LSKHQDQYHVRGITRDLEKPTNRVLIELGIELRKADLNHASTLQSAFEGAYGIYAMTDFWHSMSDKIEISQGKAIAEAAERIPTLEHLIWASIPNPLWLSNRRFNIRHWKSKSDVIDYIQQTKPALSAKMTTVLFPHYFENTITRAHRYLPTKVPFLCPLDFWI
jgi:hypothetical protein